MKKLKPIHPFPARMAPEIALEECEKLSPASVVLDPMCGSGTTLRMAIEHNLVAIGSDLDPMAVLIAGVNTTPLDAEDAISAAIDVAEKAQGLPLEETYLPWIDEDAETQKFIDFWFAEKQINDLRKIMTIIWRDYKGPMQAFLKVAVSRLIVTKEQSASLARDTSHSRPHRVTLTNDYEVFPNFIRSAKQIASRLPQPSATAAKVSKADARNLATIADNHVDMVITSPPYLNAIDYMRGHKLSLVWLGHKLSDLREIRSKSIGAEKKPDSTSPEDIIAVISQDMDFYEQLDPRQKGMFDRYILDMFSLMEEIERVLKPNGKALLVVGNSCLKGIFIKNTMAVTAAAKFAGLEFVSEIERELPANKRYLPPPSALNTSFLTNRMRTESILSFSKPVFA